jgi:hypothetical protein
MKRPTEASIKTVQKHIFEKNLKRKAGIAPKNKNESKSI